MSRLLSIVTLSVAAFSLVAAAGLAVFLLF
jgi:hypothetical protein